MRVVVVVVSTGDVQRPAVARTTLLPAEVGRLREGFGEALVDALGVEDLGLPALALVHDARVLELLDESLLAPATGDERGKS